MRGKNPRCAMEVSSRSPQAQAGGQSIGSEKSGDGRIHHLEECSAGKHCVLASKYRELSTWRRVVKYLNAFPSRIVAGLKFTVNSLLVTG